MPKSRNRKDHKEKLDSRRQAIVQQKNAVKKMQTKYLEELIKREQLAGAFNNDGNDLLTNIDGPDI